MSAATRTLARPPLSQSLDRPEYHYVTDAHGEDLAVYVLVKPRTHATAKVAGQVVEFAWTDPGERPEGDGWGNFPAQIVEDNEKTPVRLFWTRPVKH